MSDGLRTICSKCGRILRNRFIAHGTDSGHDPWEYSELYEVDPHKCTLHNKSLDSDGIKSPQVS